MIDLAWQKYQCPAHLKTGLALAKSIVPLDRDGHPSASGKIVLLSIGMSNATQEFRSFLTLAKAHRPGLNPCLEIVDGAQSSQTAAKIIDPNLPYWNTPITQCLDGRKDVKCVDYAKWTQAWTQIKG